MRDIFFGRTIHILSRSGGGKDTQAEYLCSRILRELGVLARYFYLGSELRALAEKDIPAGREMKTILDRKEFPPTLLVSYTMCAPLREARDQPGLPIVYNGSPRMLEEAEMIDFLCKVLGRVPPIAVYLDTSEAECRRRLLGRGRFDDSEDGITKRLEEFAKHTERVLEHFRGTGRLIAIAGEGAPEEIADNLWNALMKMLIVR
jgi:adenylate kinase family enzyme